jgi:hypothetical protein
MNANAPKSKLLVSALARFLLGALLLFPGALAGDGANALINISRNGGDVEIEFIGDLQSANSLAGPWVDESGGSPKTVSLSGAPARYYRIKPFELPATARFSVDLETGEVAVVPIAGESTRSKSGLSTAAVFGGSTIGFDSTVLLDEEGDPGRKVLSVSLVNQTGETVGENPNGIITGIKVLFGGFRNLSAPSDLRLQSMVSTIAGSGAAGSTDGPALSATFLNPVGVAAGPDGTVYIADGPAHRIRKLSQHQVSTVAGSGAPTSLDGAGPAATFNFPRAIAYSAALNGFVIAEQNGRRIRLLTPDGNVTTIAGTGVAGGTDGAGTVATFNGPTAVAVDAAGAIYIGEFTGRKIRKITLTGPDPRLASSYTVSTWAGSGVSGNADGVGTAAQFKSIYGLAAEPDGTLYAADPEGFRIRRISPAREVVTIAGGDIPGSVDGNGLTGRFVGPAGIVLLNGSLAVSEYTGNTVRLLTLSPGGAALNPADWQVRTLAGTGVAGSTDGRGDVAEFRNPFSLTADAGGNLIIADYSNRKLRRVSPAAGFFAIGTPSPTTVTEPTQLSNPQGFQVFSTLTGRTLQPFMIVNEKLVPGAASAPQKWAFEVPAGVTGFEFDVTVMAPTDTKIPLAVVSNPGPTGVGSPNVLVSTLAGQGLGGYINGPGNVAKFSSANGITVDREGNIFVADSNNHAIRRISRDGVVTAVAGGLSSGFIDGRGDIAKFNGPRGISVTPDGRTIYVTDSNNHSIRRIVQTGFNPALPGSWTVATIAGTSAAATYVDNTFGNAARFNFPVGIVWTPGDLVYVTEFSGNRVRRLQAVGVDLQLSTSWHVTLVGGSTVSPVGTAGNIDGFGTSARFDLPAHIAVDQAGNLYVADVNNNRIRKINPDTDVSTLAGSTFGYADGVGTAAKFGQPNGVTVDSAGYVYVSDTSFHRIRRVSPSGVVTTIAGTGDTFPGDIDGGGDVARFYFPLGIAVDSAGSLYVVSGGTYLFSGGGGVTSPGLRVRMIQGILR